MYKNGMLQFLSFWVFPAIDVKSVMYTELLPGNWSTSNVVKWAVFVAWYDIPLHSLAPNSLYLSNEHVNGGFIGFARSHF